MNMTRSREKSPLDHKYAVCTTIPAWAIRRIDEEAAALHTSRAAIFQKILESYYKGNQQPDELISALEIERLTSPD